MDRILIEGLRVRCIVGADEAERREKQDVVISLAITADLSKACRSDRLEDTVDYRSLRKRIVARVEESDFFLIEGLAEAVAGICLEHPLVSRVVVRVEKPAAFGHACSVGVEVTRERTLDAGRKTPDAASTGDPDSGIGDHENARKESPIHRFSPIRTDGLRGHDAESCPLPESVPRS